MCYKCNGVYDFDSEGRRQELLKCFDCHRNGGQEERKKKGTTVFSNINQLIQLILNSPCDMFTA